MLKIKIKKGNNNNNLISPVRKSIVRVRSRYNNSSSENARGGIGIRIKKTLLGGSFDSSSTPTAVDVSANGMAKKYSRGSIKTSYGSSGLLTGSRLNKKTLLGE